MMLTLTMAQSHKKNKTFCSACTCTVRLLDLCAYSLYLCRECPHCCYVTSDNEKLVSRLFGLSQVECLEEMAYFCRSLWRRSTSKCGNVLTLPQVEATVLETLFLFYEEKSTDYKEDADVSKGCSSALLHPVRCPVNYFIKTKKYATQNYSKLRFLGSMGRMATL